MVKKKKTKNISNSDIYVSDLPKKYYTNGTPSSPLYCVMVDDVPLKTPEGNIIADKNKRAIQALAAEIEFTSILNVENFSLYSIFCNQIDFIAEWNYIPNSGYLPSLVWNDVVLRPVTGSEAIQQFKFLGVVIDFLLQNNLEYPNFLQIPFETALEEHILDGYKDFYQIHDFVKNELEKLGQHEIVIFMMTSLRFSSPILGLMLIQEKINAQEFAAIQLAMLASSGKVWNKGNTNKDKQILDACLRDINLMQQYLSFFKKEENTELLKVFICYASEDQLQAKNLYEKLSNEKWVSPWIDDIDLLPGTEWDVKIQKELRNSDVVIICMSNESISKEGYIQKEIRHALDVANEKPEDTIFIIPLKLEECTPPKMLSKYQWVNYFDNHGYEKLINSLESRASRTKSKTLKQEELRKNHQGFIKKNIESIILNSLLLTEKSLPQIATLKAQAKLRDIDARLGHIDYKDQFNNWEFSKRRIHEFNEVTGFDFSENDITLIDYLLVRPEQLPVWYMFNLVYGDNSETEWQTYKGYFESYYIANFSTDDLKAREADLWLLEKAKRFYEIVKKNIQGVEPKSYYETLDLSDFE